MVKPEMVECVTAVASQPMIHASGRVVIALELENGTGIGIFLSQPAIDQLRKDLAVCEAMLRQGSGSA